MTHANGRDGDEEPRTAEPFAEIVTIVVRGDLDAATSAEFAARAVARLGALPLREVVVDLTEAGFVDSSGLGALVRVRMEARRRSARVRLVGADVRLHKLLRIAGLDGHFLEA